MCIKASVGSDWLVHFDRAKKLIVLHCPPIFKMGGGEKSFYWKNAYYDLQNCKNFSVSLIIFRFLQTFLHFETGLKCVWYFGIGGKKENPTFLRLEGSLALNFEFKSEGKVTHCPSHILQESCGGQPKVFCLFVCFFAFVVLIPPPLAFLIDAVKWHDCMNPLLSGIVSQYEYTWKIVLWNNSGYKPKVKWK